MSRVLVTGGAGFIGRNLIARLREAGDDTYWIDNLSVVPRRPPVGAGEVRDVRTLTPADCAGYDSVVHLAAMKSVPRSFGSAGAYTHNVTADAAVLHAAAEASVEVIVMASSCEVYGHGGASALREEVTLSPRSPYAAAKLATEQLVSVYSSISPSSRFVVPRLFNVYGPDEGLDALVPRFLYDALTIGAVEIEGDGSQERDFSYIADCVALLVGLIEAETAVGPVNVGSGTASSVNHVLQQIEDIVGRRIERKLRPRRMNEVSSFCADRSHLDSLVTIARTPLRTGLEMSCAEMRQSDVSLLWASARAPGSSVASVLSASEA